MPLSTFLQKRRNRSEVIGCENCSHPHLYQDLFVKEILSSLFPKKIKQLNNIQNIYIHKYI